MKLLALKLAVMVVITVSVLIVSELLFIYFTGHVPKQIDMI